MTLKTGAFWPLVEIDFAGGIIGIALALGWAKATGSEMDRDRMLFLVKMFGGICLAFLVIILVAR